MGGVLSVIWAVIVALKVAGVGTLVTTSWALVIFWPVMLLAVAGFGLFIAYIVVNLMKL